VNPELLDTCNKLAD